MIEIKDVSKRYGDKLAVDSLSFAVQPGMVTGFLGPIRSLHGAGNADTTPGRRLLPPDCLGQLIAQQPHANDLSRPWSFVVIVAYPVVLLALADYALRRRDA
jgi:hypothetical protein